MPFPHEDWRGRIRANAGVATILTPDKVELFDQNLAALLQTKYPTLILQVDH